MACCFFFFNDTATTEIYTLSLHDALPIWARAYSVLPSVTLAIKPPYLCSSTAPRGCQQATQHHPYASLVMEHFTIDRKSTRLNSSHANISYAVFCLKKKKNITVSEQLLYH